MVRYPSVPVQGLKVFYREAGGLFFTPEGGRAYLRDLPDAGLHMLGTGHFALEDHSAEIADLIAVSVGLPRVTSWRGKPVETGIFKAPVAGPVMVRRLNLDGDRQADLSVHGGAEKAVYGYPAEHYAFWRTELGEELSWGAFGENLTTAGLDEQSLHIGDRLRIGAAELVVTQPRLPCFKLGVRFRRPDMVKRFLASGRTGFYFSVLREGQVAAGDQIIVIVRDPRAVTVADIARIATFDRDDLATIRRAVAVPALAESWRTYFADQLAAASNNEAPAAWLTSS